MIKIVQCFVETVKDLLVGGSLETVILKVFGVIKVCRSEIYCAVAQPCDVGSASILFQNFNSRI